MTVTTIKVPVAVRDALKQQAAAHRHTLAQHLEYLMEEEARRERFAQLREAMASTPPDENYAAESRQWQADGWN